MKRRSYFMPEKWSLVSMCVLYILIYCKEFLWTRTLAGFSGSRANLPFIRLQGELLKQGRLDQSNVFIWFKKIKFKTFLLIFRLQGELLKQGRLDRSYVGVADCVKRTWAHEGILAFWRGNFASVVRYFPQQVGWYQVAPWGWGGCSVNFNCLSSINC